MILKRSILPLATLILLLAAFIVGAQTDLDYPPQPTHSYMYATGYSNYRLGAVCHDTSSGMYVYNITADPNFAAPDVMTFDFWSFYANSNTRWPLGRYGWLRPYRIQVSPGQNNFIAVEGILARIARGGLYDYRQTAQSYESLPCPNFGSIETAVILATFPQTGVPYNPPGVTYIPPQSVTGAGQGASACTDIVNLGPAQSYRVYEVRPDGTQNNIDSGTLGYGASLNLSRFTVTVYVEMGGRVQRYDC